MIAVLKQLLERADTIGETQVTADVVAQWPEGCLDKLLALGLMVQAGNEIGLYCDQCEEHCWLEPTFPIGSDGTNFLTHPCIGREDIGILEFRPEQLLTWRLNFEGITAAVGGALGLDGEIEVVVPGRLWSLGRLRRSGRAHTFFFGWGYDLHRNEELVLATDGRMRSLNGVLLVPHSIPQALSSGTSPGPIIPLTAIVSFSNDGLQLDTALVQTRLGKPSRKQPVEPFPMPPGPHSWNQVTIRVLSDTEAEAIVGSIAQTRTFADWGMADTRSGRASRHAASWTILRALAEHSGELTWHDQGASPKARTQIKKLRACLREIFGIEDDPFEKYKQGVGWRAKFILTDARLSAP